MTISAVIAIFLLSGGATSIAYFKETLDYYNTQKEQCESDDTNDLMQKNCDALADKII